MLLEQVVSEMLEQIGDMINRTESVQGFGECEHGALMQK